MFRKLSVLLLIALFAASCTTLQQEAQSNTETNQVLANNTDQTYDIAIESTPTVVVNQTEDNSIIESENFLEEVTLFAPLGGNIAYLVDTAGEIVHQWELSGTPANSVYLLEDNTLLASYAIPSSDFLAQGTSGGGIELLDWDGNQLWTYELSNETYLMHHDIEPLPNGNILAIAYEKISADEAIANGVNSQIISTTGEIWSEAVFEINPVANTIVWEWHVWDHLLAEDENAVEYPELIDPNYPTTRRSADWLHFNAIDYNEELDQIMLSSRTLSEIWIIDHNTTSEEAAGDAGNLLFRWGNPEAYGAEGEQQLFGQHDAEWIDPEDAESNVTVFNNGDRSRDYSTVLELDLNLSSSSDEASIVWEYGDSDGEVSFYSDHISGVQRLENGNTLVCSGVEGYFFEINAAGELVWEYTNEFGNTTPKGEIHTEVFRAVRYYINTEFLNL